LLLYLIYHQLHESSQPFSTGYCTLQIDLLNKPPSVTGIGLTQLGATLGQVIDTIYSKLVKGRSGLAGYPQFNYTDIHTFTQCLVLQNKRLTNLQVFAHMAHIQSQVVFATLWSQTEIRGIQ
jgi:hypothetical protein